MQTFWRIPVLVAAVLSVLSVIPDRAAAQNAVAPKSGDYFNFFELNVYGGWGNYAKQTGQPFSQLEQGGLMGARTTENFWNYFALEQDFGFYSYHRLTFRGPTPGGIPLPIFGTHVYQGAFNGVLHFTPRDSKFRPFVTAGVGEANYVPNDAARKTAEHLPPSAGFSSFGSKGGLEANYGGGLKYQVSPRFGVRVDARGYYGRTPQFGVPSHSVAGSASIPYGFRNFGVQLTGGFTMYFGHIGEAPAPPVAAPPPPPPPPPRCTDGGPRAMAAQRDAFPRVPGRAMSPACAQSRGLRGERGAQRLAQDQDLAGREHVAAGHEVARQAADGHHVHAVEAAGVAPFRRAHENDDRGDRLAGEPGQRRGHGAGLVGPLGPHAATAAVQDDEEGSARAEDDVIGAAGAHARAAQQLPAHGAQPGDDRFDGSRFAHGTQPGDHGKSADAHGEDIDPPFVAH
jgi:hypothetical protein